MDRKLNALTASIVVVASIVAVFCIRTCNREYRIVDNHCIEVIEGHEYITNGKYMCHSVSCKYCKNK